MARLSVTILGDGGWGTALALHLYHRGHQVLWWGAESDYVQFLNRRRENVKYLPGVRIPRSLPISADLKKAVGASRLIILAIPSLYLRRVLNALGGINQKDKIWLSVAKGLERETRKRMSEVVLEALGPVPMAVLSGPNIASEIARGHPASSVVASNSSKLAIKIQRAFMDDRMRLYVSSDVIGVEMGGALKNPIAIAAGICDGLKLGSNAKAALMTRGIVEMSRLGVAMGAREETFWGLSGVGDLITTCFSGRNRWLGEQLGKGRLLQSVLRSTPMVIEGVETSKAAVTLGRRFGVELPIIEQVHAILFKRRSPRQALRTLMARKGRSEI